MILFHDGRASPSLPLSMPAEHTARRDGGRGRPQRARPRPRERM